MLREGIYDIESSELNVPVTPVVGGEIENAIMAFLSQEDIRPVNLGQYLNDAKRFQHDKKSTEVLTHLPVSRNTEELITRTNTPMKGVAQLSTYKFKSTP